MILSLFGLFLVRNRIDYGIVIGLAKSELSDAIEESCNSTHHEKQALSLHHHVITQAQVMSGDFPLTHVMHRGFVVQKLTFPMHYRESQ